MPTRTTYDQLAQRLITTTATTKLYSPKALNTTGFVNLIIICNTTNSAATYSLWVNQNGSVNGDQFAIMKNIPIAAAASDQRVYPGSTSIVLVGNTASILVAASVANALNFTIYGYEIEQF